MLESHISERQQISKNTCQYSDFKHIKSVLSIMFTKDPKNKIFKLFIIMKLLLFLKKNHFKFAEFCQQTFHFN